MARPGKSMEGIPELIGVFVEEMTELLDGVDAALADLRADPGDFAAARCLHRVAHTLKTSAGLMGFPSVGQFAVTVEKSLGPARRSEAPVDEANLRALGPAFAFMSEIIAALAAGNPEDSALIDERTAAFRAVTAEV